MKFLKLFISVIWLSGCYYSFKTGCFYTPQNVSCYDGASDITRLQKKESIGFTDAETRWNDLESCGGVRVKDGNFILHQRKEFVQNFQKYREKYYELYKVNTEYEKKLTEEYKYLTPPPINPRFDLDSFHIYISELYSCMRRKGYINLSRIECHQNYEKCK
ncbi:hypothetical protein JFL47_12125 [Haemophilus haemoglobinophilus]|nr:hypothetical protein [Canicola haemoglobinophilus]